MLIDDVIVGCAVPEAEQGMNVARLSAHSPVYRIVLVASPSIVYAHLAWKRLPLLRQDTNRPKLRIILAGGVESMSMLPFGGHHIRPNPRCFSGYKPALTYTNGHNRRSGC